MDQPQVPYSAYIEQPASRRQTGVFLRTWITPAISHLEDTKTCILACLCMFVVDDTKLPQTSHGVYTTAAYAYFVGWVNALAVMVNE